MLSNGLHTNNLTCDREGRLGITVYLYYKKRAHPEFFFAFGHCLKIVGGGALPEFLLHLLNANEVVQVALLGRGER